ATYLPNVSERVVRSSPSTLNSVGSGAGCAASVSKSPAPTYQPESRHTYRPDNDRPAARVTSVTGGCGGNGTGGPIEITGTSAVVLSSEYVAPTRLLRSRNGASAYGPAESSTGRK